MFLSVSFHSVRGIQLEPLKDLTPIQSCIQIWSQNTVLKIKKRCCDNPNQNKKKKDIKSKQDSSIITLFLWEKRDKKKPKSYIYTYYSKSKPYRSAKKKKIFQISQKMRLPAAACAAAEPKKQNAYQGVTEVYLLLLFCWMNLTVLSKCDRNVRF